MLTVFVLLRVAVLSADTKNSRLLIFIFPKPGGCVYKSREFDTRGADLIRSRCNSFVFLIFNFNLKGTKKSIFVQGREREEFFLGSDLCVPAAAYNTLA